MPAVCSPWLRYGAAVLSVVVAIWIRMLLDPLLGDQYAYLTFFLSVVFAAWYGGLGPSLVALMLGTLSAAYFFLSPRHSFAVEGFEHQMALGVYFSLGIASVLVMQSQRRARHRAETSTRDALRKKQALEREILERERVQEELARLNAGLEKEVAE